MLTGRERGFTMMELAVAMFVALVALAAFVVLFRSSFLRSGDINAASMSGAQLTDALDRIGDDLRAARSAARGEISSASTKDDLRSNFSTDPVRFGDIAWASGQQLAIWSDAEADPAGPRCATWSFRKVPPHDEYALVRRSGAPGGACPVTTGAYETIVGIGAAAPPANVFRYGVLTPTGPATCRVTNTSPGAMTSMTASQRLRIVSVDVALGASNRRQTGDRNADGRTAIDLWSRLNDDYYYAVGCAL